jgi:hypothetical protein
LVNKIPTYTFSAPFPPLFFAPARPRPSSDLRQATGESPLSVHKRTSKPATRPIVSVSVHQEVHRGHNYLLKCGLKHTVAYFHLCSCAIHTITRVIRYSVSLYTSTGSSIEKLNPMRRTLVFLPVPSLISVATAKLYRQRVAPSRPGSAPDVDYGGRHPFDLYREEYERRR